MEKRIIPVFATETEEADWWYDNREELGREMVAAMREGRTGEGAVARMKRRQAEREREAAPIAAEQHT